MPNAECQSHVPLAIVFFLWIGIFNLMVIAQFWSFANDIYTKDQGERLFAIVGFGASLGALAGSRIADRLIEPVGIYQMMLVGAGILIAQLLLTNYLDRRGSGHVNPGIKQAAAAPKTSGSDAFALVFRTRYLLLMALMLMLLNWVNTTGEYILGSIVKDSVSEAVASGKTSGLTPEQMIGDFYSKYFTYVNIVGLFMQLFVVSRVVKYLGVRKAVVIHPLISLCAYNVLIFFPTLMNLDARRYQPIVDRQTLVLSSLLTLQTGTLGEDVPIYGDYSLGGENTIRGWPFGSRRGKNQFINTVEYRYVLVPTRNLRVFGINLYGGVAAAIFGDLGAVWSEPDELADRFIGGGGIGLRLVVPFVNLVRLDLSWGQPNGDPLFQLGVNEKFVAQRNRVR